MGNISVSYNLQSPLEVKIEWCRQTDTPPITLCISALLLNKDTNLVDKIEDFVFYGTPLASDGKKISTINGEIKCDSLNFKRGFGTGADYKMTIDLDKINPDINKIRIIASIVSKNDSTKAVPGFDSLSKARFTLSDHAGNIYRCDLENEADSMSRSVDVAIVQRWDKNWRLFEELNFHLGGLSDIYDDDSYVNRNLSLNKPFSSIGDIFEIEQSYERYISIRRDGKKEKVTRVDKFIKRIKGYYRKPQKTNIDSFFDEETIIPQLQEKDVERDAFNFGSKKTTKSSAPDFSFGNTPPKKEVHSEVSDRDFDFGNTKNRK